jgi:mono/diheme cytochrome c family protein
MKPRQPVLAACLLAGLASSSPIQADNGRAMPRTVPPAYTEECGACHVAYPPSLLPARSWQRVMTGLDRHYGTDATLDAAALGQLDAWLQAHAGTYKRVTSEPPEDRITRSAWFERKHRGIDAATWKLPDVQSAANCAACHGDAAQGRFDDDELRQPAGLTPRQRKAWIDD